MKILAKFLFLFFLTPFLLIGGEIYLGGLFDLSGPTASVGKPYFYGVRDYLRYINSKGGINGQKIVLKYYDYRYDVNKSLSYAKNLIYDDHVIGIIGWGTGDSLKLKPIMERNHIPYIPASLCKKLILPPDNHYMFLTALSYSDEMNSIIKFIATSRKFENRDVGIISNPTDFGTAPLPDVKRYAEGTVNISFVYLYSLRPAPRDEEKLKKLLEEKRPPILILHTTPGPFLSVVKIISSIPDYNPLALFGTFYTFDSKVAKGVPSNFPAKIFTINYFALWNENVHGVTLIKSISREYHGNKKQPVYYIEGAFNAMLFVEALKKVKGEVTGEKLKKSMESTRGFSTGGLSYPVSFSPEDHVAIEKLRITRLNLKRRRFENISFYLSPY